MNEIYETYHLIPQIDFLAYQYHKEKFNAKVSSFKLNTARQMKGILSLLLAHPVLIKVLLRSL